MFNFIKSLIKNKSSLSPENKVKDTTTSTQIIKIQRLNKPENILKLNEKTNNSYWQFFHEDRLRKSIDPFENNFGCQKQVFHVKSLHYKENISAQYTSQTEIFFSSWQVAYYNHAGIIVSPDDLWT